MNIVFHEKERVFRLYNKKISYIMIIMKNEQLGHLYYGKYLKNQNNFANMFTMRSCACTQYNFKDDMNFSLELIKQEYPAYGTGDYRNPAYQMEMDNGSRITNFIYHSHIIYNGKKKLQGLPNVYGDEKDVMTLEITMYDAEIKCYMILKYHIFEEYAAIIRSVEFNNTGDSPIKIQCAMSMCLDLYDSEYEMLQLDGAWSRERHVHGRKLGKGVQSVSSSRGASSAIHNPFIALKRIETTEFVGEVYGFSMIYSGNFTAKVEVDAFDISRVLMGINEFEFEWKLECQEKFQTPEVVIVYSDLGLGDMSRTYHDLYRNQLIRGKWKNEVRPILINNWEATYFDFDENKIIEIAKEAKRLGVELFVLDDGWFGNRNDDRSSLGDWYTNLEKLPNGVAGLSKKINELDLEFGLWFEPEMVNEDSFLFRQHPEWVVHTPNRSKTYGRNQFVLDFTNRKVVSHIFTKMCDTLDGANVSYIKWDMNRSITEAFSLELPKDRQKEFFHRYILGVYKLYDMLITRYPDILFESCASGGGRFDPGMLYYAPQTWTSDDTDAIERLPIQYGTSMVYPLISMGSHVSAIPNHQVGRSTSMSTRANVAYFGTFGYELDLNLLSEDDKEKVKKQNEFFKENRETIQFGDFYRLKNGSDNIYSWMVVSKDKKEAILGYYKILAKPNPSLKKIKLVGLDNTFQYYCEQTKNKYFGDELMNFGLVFDIEFTGVIPSENYEGDYNSGKNQGDFTSQIYVFKKI